LRADDLRYALTVASDVDALEKLLTHDFTYTHNAGYTDDKSSYLNRIRTGGVRYRDATRVTESTRIHGATGIMTGHMRMIAHLSEQAVQLDNVFLAVWIFEEQDWLLAAWASTTRGA
jgi:hypothetical protein